MLLRTAVLVHCIRVVTLLWLVLGVPLLANGQSTTGPPPGVAVHPTATFDPSGRVWVAWVEDSHVVVAESSDQGRSFRPGVRVTREPEPLDANGDARPKIAIGREGDVFVAWTRAGTRPYTGDIRFARSVDDGHTFSEPIIVNDDGLAIGHRFETLGVNARGDLFLVWIDKRDLEATQTAGQDYAGAALYYTWSTDGGLTFAKNRKIKDHICECCRIAVAFGAEGWPVLVWRDVLPGGIRDHRVVRFLDANRWSAMGRVAEDHWRIDACPHHGPGLAIDADGTYHTVWATGESPRGPGSFYAQSVDQGGTFSTPVPVGSPDTLAHADVAAVGRQVALVWKQKSMSGDTGIGVRLSHDGGRTWGATREVARTEHGSDHPLVVSDGHHLFLSWHTRTEGWRLIPLAVDARH